MGMIMDENNSKVQDEKTLVANVVVAQLQKWSRVLNNSKTIKISYKCIGCIFENFFLCEMS